LPKLGGAYTAEAISGRKINCGSPQLPEARPKRVWQHVPKLGLRRLRGKMRRPRSRSPGLLLPPSFDRVRSAN